MSLSLEFQLFGGPGCKFVSAEHNSKQVSHLPARAEINYHPGLAGAQGGLGGNTGAIAVPGNAGSHSSTPVR